jgi:hypothetical protein
VKASFYGELYEITDKAIVDERALGVVDIKVPSCHVEEVSDLAVNNIPIIYQVNVSALNDEEMRNTENIIIKEFGTL